MAFAIRGDRVAPATIIRRATDRNAGNAIER
jgi:hypothetical protein